MNKKFFSLIAIFAVFCGILAMVQVTTAAPKGGTPKYSCSDTDGGNVITVFGTVSGYYNKVWYSDSDYCVDAGNILEYYCSGVYEQSQQQSCGTDGYVGSNYCSSEDVYKDWRDYACGSGACSYTDTPTLQQDCGTDGYVGSNYCYNGDVYKNWRDIYCASGACGYTDTPTLQQDCVDGQYCSAGACVWNNTCSETDGGAVVYIQGTTYGTYQGGNYSFTDFCLDSDVIMEYFCSGSSRLNWTASCSTLNATACINGACV